MSAVKKEEEQSTASKLARPWSVTATTAEPIPAPPASNDVRDPGLSIRKLIHEYKRDPVGTYKTLRYKTRQHYDSMLRLIERDYGDTQLKDIKARVLKEWYAAWETGGHISAAHSKIGMLRTLMRYGMTLLEDEECTRLATVLNGLRFKMSKPREVFLTAGQIVAVRAQAHKVGRASIARANAFQFECTCRQKDIIGDWEPINEPGTTSTIIVDRWKWVRGIVWSEIDADGLLTHITSKKQKKIVVDLKLAPMVIDELNLAYPGAFYQVKSNETAELEWRIDRSKLPEQGPVIVSEFSELPWRASEFRRQWRKIARAVGIPDDVWNMDSRAGAITEATLAGVPLEHVAQAATHSQTSQTAKYSRDAQNKTASTMKARVAARHS